MKPHFSSRRLYVIYYTGTEKVVFMQVVQNALKSRHFNDKFQKTISGGNSLRLQLYLPINPPKPQCETSGFASTGSTHTTDIRTTSIIGVVLINDKDRVMTRQMET